MFRRSLKLSKSSSFFLFGARGTGKSTLLREVLFSSGEALSIDLLLPGEFDRLMRNPESLLDQIRGLPPEVEWVILDEVQKIPPLLDVVHYAIENFKIKFALSSSSARKLKRGGANLLAGRAFVYNLFPLTVFELGESFDLETQLKYPQQMLSTLSL
jgi:predicted AAA+ superfamily ATPase